MKIIIQANAYTKLDKFVHLVDTEISGMAKSKLDKEKNIIITDFMIFNQEVTETNTLIKFFSVIPLLLMESITGFLEFIIGRTAFLATSSQINESLYCNKSIFLENMPISALLKTTAALPLVALPGVTKIFIFVLISS